MIGILFVINTALALVVALATTMLQNHFDKIEKGMAVYLDPKAYKTRSKIAFITEIVECYKKVKESQDDNRIDVESMVQRIFYEQKVGKFSYYLVQNITLKGKFLMWVVLFLQIALEIFSSKPGQSITNFIIIVASTLLCALITLASILKNVVEQKEQLFIRIQDFIVNSYPTELKEREKQKDIQALLEKIERLENELAIKDKDKLDKKTDQILNEEDIKLLLSKIDL